MLNPKQCVLYSGGAAGTEQFFGALAEGWGIEEVNYSFEGHQIERKRGVRVLTSEELALKDVSLTYVSKLMNREYTRAPIFRKVLQSICWQVSSGNQVIVIGAIQLGATVDYAILMTTRYQKERQNGKDKMEAISIAHKTSMPSIISSGLSFFAATFGVSLYSQVEMIGAICTLLARGAIISMIVVIMILPAMFMIFDKVICKTSIGFLKKKA